MTKYTIILFLCLISLGIEAQGPVHSFSFSLGTGYNSLNYKANEVNSTSNMGVVFDFGYSYYLKSHWGIHTGIGVRSYSSKVTLNYASSNPAVDSQGEPFEFRYELKNWTEQQSFNTLDIPLLLEFRKPLHSSLKLLFSIGPQISIPFSKRYKMLEGQVTTTGFYSKWNVELYDLPQYDFSTYDKESGGSISIKPSYSLLANVGIHASLYKNIDWYSGLSFSYGLNNIANNHSEDVYNYGGVYNGVLNSNLLEKANLISFAFKVGVIFNPSLK